MTGFDRGMLWLLMPLAWTILLSGLDDIVVDAFWAFAWIKAKVRPAARLFPPGEGQLASAPQRRIAILVPLWHEHEVIGKMLEHNFASIRYSDYHIFAGCYPNDDLTQEAVQSAAARFPNVHLALCPHDGPTSKADCLNWIFQHLLLEEEAQGEPFEVIVTHDAEDLIHPEELRWINYYSGRFDFIQTPVLALPTPLWDFTHGVYCDEFAEYHTRDMTVRAISGGFVPSSGVGTGYRREALERLARASSNRIFDPEALTEDYVNGLRLFRLKCTQTFVPLGRGSSAPDLVATRELFPQTWGAALRQRTRWVTGIALQGWQQFGWRGTPGEVYWLWRDRKGLIGNPLSLLSNAVFAYGVATSLWTRMSPAAARVGIATLTLQLLRAGIRMACVARVYGLPFSLGVPFRAVYANALNSAATFQALGRYAVARALGRPLKWLKTEHAYPTRAILLAHKRRLGDILIGSGHLTPDALAAALEFCPPSLRLGEHLINTGQLTPEVLYEALSVQQGLPVVEVDAGSVPVGVAHALPEKVARDWKVLPFRVADGNLFLAGPEIPTPETTRALRPFTSLELRFHLVTPDAFETLAGALL
ncbi:MAG TPA: glycosyl transferase family protein [Bryobacteraceae bacterium]